MNPTTALTSSLRQAALRKSGSRSTVIAVPRSASATVAAAGVSGSTSRASLRNRTHPPGCGLRRDPHRCGHHVGLVGVAAGPADPFDLLDAVLQRAHHGVLVAQPVQPACGPGRSGCP